MILRHDSKTLEGQRCKAGVGKLYSCNPGKDRELDMEHRSPDMQKSGES